ncbi:MAG: DUF4367 domain-containing protein [Tyzzerella sp.]|nr:DUF4367 domain-containing protein [Tyzzerella sp.]
MDDKMNRFIQMESEKEADRILEEVNRDPEIRNLKAPDEIRDKLFAQIREYEAQKAYENLSEEDKELIRLGKVYKRKRKWTKWIVLAAALVLAMMFGVTSMGGPEQVVEKVKWMLGGREQTNIDSEDKRVKESEGVNEEEAYQQIEDEFQFAPVRPYYMPVGMEFQDIVIYKDTQSAQILYEQENVGVIAYIMRPNYRVSSIGGDIEDTLIEEYTKDVSSAIIHIKQYYVDDNGDSRWIAEFEYQNVYYFLQIFNLSKENVNEILENLYFP